MKNKLRKKKLNISFTFFKRRSLVWFLAFVLLALHVFFAVQTSAMGARIAFYEEEIQNIEKENDDLSRNLINSTSLTKLSQVSDELGYQKSGNMLYIHSEESFAKAR